MGTTMKLMPRFLFGNKNKEINQQALVESPYQNRTIVFGDGRKLAVPDYGNYSSLVDLLTTGGNFTLVAIQCINYYRRCSPLANAVDTIGHLIEQIRPLIYNQEEEEFITKHPLLKLFKTPNADIVYKEFIFSIIVYYLLTGNCYLIATGSNPRKEPGEVMVAKPQMVTIMVGKDGYPEFYYYNTFYGSYQFIRKEVNGRFRYYAKDGTHELYHIKNINPMATAQMVYGMSRLNPLFYEIEQFISASTHNLSILKRGAFPSGFFTTDMTLTDDQFTKLEMDMQRIYSGSQNSGRAGILEDGMKFLPTTLSNKDMDFAVLKKEVTENIYKNFNIPLPTVISENMTLNNYEIADYATYTKCILPLVERIFEELTYFLMPRYGDEEELMLFYDRSKIPALEIKRTEEMNLMKNLGIYTPNELRSKLSSEPLAGGNIVYASGMGMTPVLIDTGDKVESINDILGEDEDETDQSNDEENNGEDQQSNNQDQNQDEEDNDENGGDDNKPSDNEEDEPTVSKAIKGKFEIKLDKQLYIDKLKRQINKDGSRRFTDEEIDQFALEIYG